MREAGEVVWPQQTEALSDLSQMLLQRYRKYLHDEKGLTDETVLHRIRVVEPFVREHYCARGTGATGDPSLQAQHTRDFFLKRTHGLRQTTARAVATTLRSFLRFLFLHGECMTDLSVAIPSERQSRKATVHAFLRDDEIEQLLRSCDTTTANGKRDYAILLILARLGMRAREVASMRLEDLQWRRGEILVRGKGRVQQRLPLLPDVGAAIADYLQGARPDSQCRNVFLRNEAPRVQLGNDAVGFVVRRALCRAGLHPPHRGSHLLRHSLATHMIRHGASLTEIGEVLQHRSPETTEIYAKVDFEGLRALALPWPTAGGLR
jgi:site-specific recombinase XerD